MNADTVFRIKRYHDRQSRGENILSMIVENILRLRRVGFKFFVRQISNRGNTERKIENQGGGYRNGKGVSTR